MKDLFSTRNNFSKKIEMQLNSVNTSLRNRLWNKVYELLNSVTSYSSLSPIEYLIWDEFFKLDVTLLKEDSRNFFLNFKRFFFELPWFGLYDLLEFLIKKEHLFSEPSIFTFKIECNRILEEENSGYRIIQNLICPITNDLEQSEISKSIENSNNFVGFQESNQHLVNSLEKLSSRLNPDYRNSIKEAISAVEAALRFLTGKPSGTLGDLLKDQKVTELKIHSAQIEAFKKMYGFTSDAGGVRHSLNDIVYEFGQEDALYMLVVCSAFTNLLVAKCNKLNP